MVCLNALLLVMAHLQIYCSTHTGREILGEFINFDFVTNFMTLLKNYFLKMIVLSQKISGGFELI